MSWSVVLGAVTAVLYATTVDHLPSESQLTAQRVLEVFTIVWVVSLGAIVGSFLNVVVYRMPRGMSLNHPKSHCPDCLTPIQGRDNLPILGWLMLRGRCRACRAAIPLRYPLVESAIAVVFLVLLLAELLRGGANLPLRIPNATHGNPVLWIIWYTKWDIVGIFLYHAVLLTMLASVALIALDGFAPPRRLLVIGLCVGVFAPIVWPGLHPVPCWTPRPAWLSNLRWEASWTDQYFSPGWSMTVGLGLDGLLDSTAGAAAGLALGWVSTWKHWKPVSAQGLRGAWLLAGVYLGWQACALASLLFGTALMLLAAVNWSHRHLQLPVWAPLALWCTLIVQIPYWEVLNGLLLRLGSEGAQDLSQAGVVACGSAAFLAVTAALAGNWLACRTHDSSVCN
ncbi:MAG: prepilin peptidase [Planctomycetaceae bacterium]